MNAVGIQDERRVGNVILPRSLRQREALLQHTEDRFSHRLGAPRFERPPLSKPQVVDEALVCVPTLLPHGL